MLKLIRAIKKSVRLEDIEVINLIIFIFSCILILFAKALNMNTIIIIGAILWIPSTIFALGSSLYDLIIIIKDETKEMIKRIKDNLN